AADRRLIDVDRLVEVLQPVDPGVPPGAALPLVDVPVEDFPENVVAERTLARPADAGHADEHPERDLDADVLQVVVPGADDLELLRLRGLPALLGDFDRVPPGQESPRQALLVVTDVVDGPLGDNLPAAHARTGAKSMMWSAASIVSSSCST